MTKIANERAGDPAAARKRAMHRALEMLSYRSRSIQEIASDLRGRGFTAETVDDVLCELERKALIGDASLARDIVTSGQRSGKSRSRIYAALRRRGIDRETAERSLHDNFDREEECRAAALAIHRMLPSAVRPAGDADIKRAAKRLAGRGFSSHSISYALNQARSEADVKGQGAFLDTESELS